MSDMHIEFHDLSELDKFIKDYEKKNYVRLWRRDSRTIKKAKAVCPVKIKHCNEELKYYSITYACGKGGKQFKSRSKGLRTTTTRKDNCPFKLRVQMTKDGQKLEVVNILEEHNHVCSKDLKDLKKRRRLNSYERAEISRRQAEETLEEDSSSPVWLNLEFNETHPDPLTQDEEHNYSSLEESSIKQERSHSPSLFKSKKKKFVMRKESYEENSSNWELREDEFDIYGKYIASQLRSMDMKNALEAQIEIQTVISRAKMASIDQS